MAKSGTNGPGSAIKTPRGLAGVSSGGPRKRVSFGMDPESGMCATPGSAKSGSVFKKKSRRQQVSMSTAVLLLPLYGQDANEYGRASGEFKLTCWGTQYCFIIVQALGHVPVCPFSR